MRAWGRRISPRGLPARTSVSARARLGAPVRSRRFPDGSFQLVSRLPAGRYSATGGGPGRLAKSWIEVSVKTRAGTSYLFASDMTILIFRGLGNGAIAAVVGQFQLTVNPFASAAALKALASKSSERSKLTSMLLSCFLIQ